ncbi:MAG TPA: hypothetical protein VE643_04065 [Nitrososphaeraceae archaeon]|nr:hypothetical protein [Nitrososphaeraceae archaeon]
MGKIEFSDVQEGNRKIIVNFVSPLGSPSDTFREYFIIERGLLKVPTASPDSSFDTHITSLKLESLLNQTCFQLLIIQLSTGRSNKDNGYVDNKR